MIRVIETSISGIPSIPGVTRDFVPKHRLVVPKMERECTKTQCDGIIQHANSNCANKNALKAGIARAEAKRSKNPQKILGTSVWGRFGQIAILGCSVVVVARKDLREPARNQRETCENLREPARTCENLRETCENLREPARTCENLRGICKKLLKFLDSSKMTKTRNFASNSYWVGVSSKFVLIWSFAHHRSKIPKKTSVLKGVSTLESSALACGQFHNGCLSMST